MTLQGRWKAAMENTLAQGRRTAGSGVILQVGSRHACMSSRTVGAVLKAGRRRPEISLKAARHGIAGRVPQRVAGAAS
jgi:hypothetical protein